MDILIIIVIIVVIVLFIGLLYCLLFKNKDENMNGGANVFFETIYRKDRGIIIKLLEEHIPKHIFYNDIEYNMYDFIILLKDSPITLYLVVSVGNKYANFYFYDDFFEARNQKDILYKSYDINNTKINWYPMMVISKYFNSINDYENLEKLTKEYNGIMEQFKYNPIPFKNDKKELEFENIETYYIYETVDNTIKSVEDNINRYNKIVCFADIYYGEYKDLLKQYGSILMKVEFKSIIFDRQDFEEIVGENNINDILEFTIPNDANISAISNECFTDCTKLSSINIPSTVVNIGDACFGNCSRLSSIRIPSGVTHIGEMCFMDCSELLSINIPSGINNLPDRCFTECNKLVSVDIPSNVTSIGKECFMNCGSLVSVKIPSSVVSIGEGCFWSCVNLISVNIPSSVTSIGDKCFNNCISLQYIKIDENNPVYRVNEHNEIVNK